MSLGTLSEWQDRATKLKYPSRAFIDGRHVEAVSGRTYECIDPATGKLLTNVAACDAPDIGNAVAAARRAFESRCWSAQSPKQRKRILIQFAELVLAHADELALLETQNVGKTITDSRGRDIPAAANCIAWYAEAIDKIYDLIAPTDPTALALVTREPLGVIGAVVPWNFPLLMAAWKFAPALAAGNSVVLKPAEQSPLTALRIAELATEAGLPDGVLNVVPGFGETAGQALGRHMNVDAITFTGSIEVGKLFLKYSSESNLKHVSLECGGKTPNIVMADSANSDETARAVAKAAFWNQGQVCTAGCRLLIDHRAKDGFLGKLLAATRDMSVGDPMDPQIVLGPLVDTKQMQKVLGYIHLGQEEGAATLLDGRRPVDSHPGNFIGPTIFDGVREHMRLAQEEIFGPVLSVMTFDGEADLLRIANGTIYGLAAALWCKDITTVHRVARRLQAGTVWVNCFQHGDITVPFGGYKQSGIGREKSLQAFDKYTQVKTTWINLG